VLLDVFDLSGQVRTLERTVVGQIFIELALHAQVDWKRRELPEGAREQEAADDSQAAFVKVAFKLLMQLVFLISRESTAGLVTGNDSFLGRIGVEANYLA
jgi:hypothetical protein